MNHKRFLAGLVTLALCVGVFGTAYAQVGFPVIVTKQARWQVWGPNGPVGTAADTTNLDGAVQDTTEAIYIGDMNLAAGGLTTGPGATTAMNGIRVTLVAGGVADNVDSVYYRVEQSVDGVHWTVPAAANNLNSVIGAIAGIDQGNAASGTTVNNSISYFIKIDQDVIDGGSTTAATFNSVWGFAPYIRIIHRNLASDVFQAAKLFVSYPGFRESH